MDRLLISFVSLTLAFLGLTFLALAFLGFGASFFQSWRENRKREQARKVRRDYFKRHFKPHDFED